MSTFSLSSALDALPDPAFVTDVTTLCIRFANSAARHMTGLAPGSILNTPLPDLFVEPFRDDIIAHITKTIEGDGAQEECEADLRCGSDGTPITLALKFSLADCDGQRVLLAIGRDVSARVELHRQLNERAILYSSLINGLSDLMFRITKDGVYRDFYIPETSGLPTPPPSQIIGRKVEDVVPEHVARVAMPAIRKVVETGEVETIEYSIAEPDGLRYYEARFVPSLSGEIVAVVRDITAKKHEAEALRYNMHMARALLNASTDSVVLIDRNWTVLAINEYSAARFGHTADEMLNTNILDYFPPEIIATRKIYSDKLFATKTPLEFEDTRAGRILFNRVNPILDEDGEIAQIAMFSRDITEQRQQEKALHRQRALLEGIATANRRLLTPGDYDKAMLHALDILGRAADVDRILVLESHTDPETGELLATRRAAWHSDTLDAAHMKSPAVNYPWVANGFGRWYDVMREGGIINSIVRDLPDHERNLLQQLGGQLALLAVPIFVNHAFWGVISLDDFHTERMWHEEEVNALRTMAASLGGAIARQQLEEDLRQKREFADILREASNTLTLTLTPEDMLSVLVKRIRAVIPYDTAAAVMLSPDSTRARIVALEGTFPLSDENRLAVEFKLPETPHIQHIIKSRECIISPDVTKDPNWIALPGNEWIRSWIAAPIIFDDRVQGFFSLDSATKNAFGPHNFEHVQAFAQQAAITLKNAAYVEDIRRLERVKSEIIHIASHDLRTPLIHIQDFLSQCREELSDVFTPEQNQRLHVMQAAARDMEHIIANILSLKRIDAQHREAQPIVWNQLISRVLETTRDEFEGHQHTLTVDVAPDLPLTFGNPFKLERAIHNLVHNAIKYTSSGGHITVRAFKKPYGVQSTVVVEVEDDGIGITTEEQACLFKPFYRVQQASTEHIPGTGLGLSMVKSVIEEHNGNVYVDSVPGQGSVFGFWVPA